MFAIPTWLNKSQQKERQYSYYEKQLVPVKTFISADVLVCFRFTFKESQSYDFENGGSILYFPKECYGLGIHITIYDESKLHELFHYDHRYNEEFEQIAMNTECYRVETEKLYNKILQQRGELPEIEIESYIDVFATKKKEHVTYSERYVGMY